MNSVDELRAELHQRGYEVSRLTVSGLRRQFRDHYKFFLAIGALRPRVSKPAPKPKFTESAADAERWQRPRAHRHYHRYAPSRSARSKERDYRDDDGM